MDEAGEVIAAPQESEAALGQPPDGAIPEPSPAPSPVPAQPPSRGPLLLITGALALGSLFVATRRRWLRLGATCQEGDSIAAPPALAPLDTAAWLLGLFLLQILAPVLPIGLLRGAVDLETLAGRALLQWTSYAAQIPFAIAIVLRCQREAALVRTPLLHSWRAGAVGLLCAAPIILFGSTLASSLQELFTGLAPPKLGHESLKAIIEQNADPWAWAVIAAVVIGAPVFEEIAYRGGLHGAMRALDIKPWPTVLLTSAFFSIMHLSAIPSSAIASAMTGLTLLAISLGILRERTGGLLAPIVAHALFNIANITLAWLSAG